MSDTISEPRFAPVLAVRPDARPEITCPNWCVMTYEDHFGDLGELEGFVIHRSELGPVTHTRAAYPDNTLGAEQPQIYCETPQSMTIEQAREIAALLIAAADEASR